VNPLATIQDVDGQGAWLQKLNAYKQQHGVEIAWCVDAAFGGMFTAELAVDRKAVAHVHGHSSKRAAREAAARLFLQRQGVA
jgi:hypothetical protein